MDNIEQKIIEAGFILPEIPSVAGLYVPAIKVGNLVFTSGQLPLKDGKLLEPGGIGKVNDTNIDAAVYASQVALINALAAIKSVTGSLSKIERVIRLTLYVASDEGFSKQHIVANGASSLLINLFKDKGIHTRIAIGVYELPINANLELELIVELL